jgi:DinB superfamily
MKYLQLDRADRTAQMGALAAMPEFVADRLASLAPEAVTRRGRDGALSPVEQCWHLADLEQEGFGVRIRRLVEETDPFLPDFDGARLVEERHYVTRSLGEAVASFRAARRANLAALRSLPADQWSRGGTQEGVGAVALCDLPHMMAEHDAGHRSEIERWLTENPERAG